MKSVKISWQIENRVMPAGTKPAHHFRAGLALQEVDVPLGSKETTFANVEAGSMAGFVAVCAEDGSELATPAVFQVEVPPDVIVPVPVSPGGVVL